MNCELVDLPFSLVWVSGKPKISLFGPGQKFLGTTGEEIARLGAGSKHSKDKMSPHTYCCLQDIFTW